MSETVQMIVNPIGVTVFGSAVIRVAPDLASMNFAVSRLDKMPKNAFEAVRKEAKAVQVYLAKMEISDFGASRVKLSQQHEYIGGRRKFVGYEARVAFNAVFADLDRVEEVLVGIVDAGANEVENVEFRTSELSKFREDARSRAVIAAREKAMNYCEAAGVALGDVLHIEDVNPDLLAGRHESHVSGEIATDDAGEVRAIDPGSIVVSGAVIVSYGIRSRRPDSPK